MTRPARVPSRRTGGRWRWALLLLLAAFFGGLLLVPGVREFLGEMVGAVAKGDGERARDVIRAYGALAPAVALALILLHIVVPFPAEVLTLADGLAFGFWGGLALSWSGFMLAALITYAAGRFWGRPVLERFVPEKQRGRLDEWLGREGFFPLLAMRLIPLIPFNALCLGAGVVKAPLRTYAWTTGLGILPASLALTYLGSSLGRSDASLGAPFWAVTAALLFAVLAGWSLHRRNRKSKGETNA